MKGRTLWLVSGALGVVGVTGVAIANAGTPSQEILGAGVVVGSPTDATTPAAGGRPIGEEPSASGAGSSAEPADEASRPPTGLLSATTPPTAATPAAPSAATPAPVPVEPPSPISVATPPSPISVATPPSPISVATPPSPDSVATPPSADSGD